MTTLYQEPCVEWDKCRDRDGYGVLTRNNKKNLRAHRVAWEDAKGSIPNGLFVLHKCDNRACINVRHLFLGTAKDNTQDMLQKGRGNRQNGSRHWQSKITDHDAKIIKQSKGNLSNPLLSMIFGIHKDVISNIKNGRAWKHVKA